MGPGGPGGPDLILRAQKVYLYPNSTSLTYRMKVEELRGVGVHNIHSRFICISSNMVCSCVW